AGWEGPGPSNPARREEVSNGGDFAADVRRRSATVLGSFAPGDRFDTRFPIAGPSELQVNPDGRPATYTFNRRTGQPYWNLGEDNVVHEIPRAFVRPTLEELIDDPSNVWTRGPRMG